MEKVNVIIERGSDGKFSCYMDSDKFNFGLYGFGDTAEAAKGDFISAYDELREYEDVELSFCFKYDVASFLQLYRQYMKLSTLEEMTGVNQRQLSQYMNGTRHASPKTTEKMEKAIHAFAEELSHVSFC